MNKLKYKYKQSDLDGAVIGGGDQVPARIWLEFDSTDKVAMGRDCVDALALPELPDLHLVIIGPSRNIVTVQH